MLPTASASSVTLASQPAYSVMSPAAWDGAGLSPFPAWREALAEAFRFEGEALLNA